MKLLKNIFLLILLTLFTFPAFSELSVEEIIKGRQAIFSENYKTAKRVQALSSDIEFEAAIELMNKMSENYKNLLDYFPENSKEGFDTEALPTIWENKDEFNALMQKAFCISALNSSLFSQIVGSASVSKPSFEFSGK